MKIEAYERPLYQLYIARAYIMSSFVNVNYELHVVRLMDVWNQSYIYVAASLLDLLSYLLPLPASPHAFLCEYFSQSRTFS